MNLVGKTMEKEKEIYRSFCEKARVPIYSQPWWLDATCLPENWGVHVIAESGQYIAAMPYYITIRNGYKLITKAHLTQTNGIIINYPKNQKYCSRLDMEEKIINEMCDYIENLGLDKYEQQFDPSFTNWLPYKWRGYTESTRYTYIIDDASNMEAVRANYSFKLRNKLKNAQKKVHLDTETSIDEFYELVKESCERDGEEMSYSYGLLKRLYYACYEQHCCGIFAARNEENILYSAILLVWDKENVYYLIGGAAPEYRSSQANAFLIDKGIEFAGTIGKSFDFEGSVIQPIERAYRAYGARQVSYFRISKSFNCDMPDDMVNHWSDVELRM